MKTLFGIQYLRAFAALAVVVFHALERTGQHFAIGAAGVDIFFVVSGFIMMAMADSRAQTPGRFFVDRLLRIVPGYWIVTSIMLVGALAGLFPNLQLGVGHVLGSYLFVPVASPSTGDLWPLLVQGWTLNYEIFFYAVFALTLFLKPGLRLAAMALVFGLLVAAGILLRPSAPLAAFYSAPLILEFVAGAGLAKLWRAGRLPPPAVGLLLVVAALCGFAGIHLLSLDFDARSCGPLAVMLVLGMLAIETGGRLPRIAALTYVGNASYSIYLWHTLAISVVVKLAGQLSLGVGHTALVAIVLGTALGIVAYECIEKPLQALIKGKRPTFPLLHRHTVR